MEHSTMTPPSNLRDYQLQKLRKLLSLQSYNQFYNSEPQTLADIADLSSIEEFAAKIAFTEKQQLISDQLNHPPFGTNLSCHLHQYKRFHQTSGTTATPLRWLDTEQSWQAILNCWQQIYRAAGVVATDRLCFAFSFGPFLGFWSAFEAASQLGCLAIPTGGMTSQARIQLILDTQATVLCCTPSYALRLAQVAKEAKLDIATSCIQRIIVAGEPGGSIPATRTLIEKAWNARVYDHHGMTETGPISYPCPLHKDTLHILEESYFAEIIDPANQSTVKRGETGELVITTLDRYASPLLRYRTGDLVQASPRPCSCGSPHLTLAGGILGRRDDMLIVRGVNVYPSAIEELVRKFAAAAEYRVIVDQRSALTEICLQIELEFNTEAETIQNELRQAIAVAMGLRSQVQVVPPGTLPRQEMKAQRWIYLNSDEHLESLSSHV
jgi:phenylacetate-CoA ligase